MSFSNPQRDPVRVIEALAHVAWPILRQCYSADCCIAASRAGIEVLRAFGVSSRPLLTTTVAMNAAYVEGLRTGVYDKARARVLVIDYESPEGFPGHVVIVGKTRGKPFLLDLSAAQMDRPAKEIHVPHEGVLIELPKNFEFKGKWEIPVALEAGGMLVYGVHPHPERADFTKMPDWCFRTPMNRAMVEDTTHKLIVAVRIELGEL